MNNETRDAMMKLAETGSIVRACYKKRVDYWGNGAVYSQPIEEDAAPSGDPEVIAAEVAKWVDDHMAVLAAEGKTLPRGRRLALVYHMTAYRKRARSILTGIILRCEASHAVLLLDDGTLDDVPYSALRLLPSEPVEASQPVAEVQEAPALLAAPPGTVLLSEKVVKPHTTRGGCA